MALQMSVGVATAATPPTRGTRVSRFKVTARFPSRESVKYGVPVARETSTVAPAHSVPTRRADRNVQSARPSGFVFMYSCALFLDLFEVFARVATWGDPTDNVNVSS